MPKFFDDFKNILRENGKIRITVGSTLGAAAMSTLHFLLTHNAFSSTVRDYVFMGLVGAYIGWAFSHGGCCPRLMPFVGNDIHDHDFEHSDKTILKTI